MRRRSLIDGLLVVVLAALAAGLALMAMTGCWSLSMFNVRSTCAYPMIRGCSHVLSCVPPIVQSLIRDRQHRLGPIKDRSHLNIIDPLLLLSGS